MFMNNFKNLGIFGLGPKSGYWKFIQENYEGPGGNTDIIASFGSSISSDPYTFLKPIENDEYKSESIGLKILMGKEPEYNESKSSKVLLKNEGEEKGLWQV